MKNAMPVTTDNPHTLSPGSYRGEWRSYEVIVRAGDKDVCLSVSVGIRGKVKVILHVSDDGSLSLEQTGN